MQRLIYLALVILLSVSFGVVISCTTCSNGGGGGDDDYDGYDGYDGNDDDNDDTWYDDDTYYDDDNTYYDDDTYTPSDCADAYNYLYYDCEIGFFDDYGSLIPVEDVIAWCEAGESFYSDDAYYCIMSNYGDCDATVACLESLF